MLGSPFTFYISLPYTTTSHWQAFQNSSFVASRGNQTFYCETSTVGVVEPSRRVINLWNLGDGVLFWSGFLHPYRDTWISFSYLPHVDDLIRHGGWGLVGDSIRPRSHLKLLPSDWILRDGTKRVVLCFETTPNDFLSRFQFCSLERVPNGETILPQSKQYKTLTELRRRRVCVCVCVGGGGESHFQVL